MASNPYLSNPFSFNHSAKCSATCALLVSDIGKWVLPLIPTFGSSITSTLPPCLFTTSAHCLARLKPTTIQPYNTQCIANRSGTTAFWTAFAALSSHKPRSRCIKWFFEYAIGIDSHQRPGDGSGSRVVSKIKADFEPIPENPLGNRGGRSLADIVKEGVDMGVHLGNDVA